MVITTIVIIITMIAFGIVFINICIMYVLSFLSMFAILAMVILVVLSPIIILGLICSYGRNKNTKRRVQQRTHQRVR